MPPNRYVVGPANPVYLVEPDDNVRRVAGPAEPVYCPWPASTAENIVTVSPSGGDFTSLKDALDSITDNSLTNRYCIDLGPGIYAENNPIQGKAYVTVRGCGLNTTRITAANSGQDLFISADLFFLQDLTVYGVAGGAWVMQITSAHTVLMSDCAIVLCSNGLRMNHASANLTTHNTSLVAPIAMTCAFCNNNGNFRSYATSIAAGSNITTVYDLDGAPTAITTIYEFDTFEAGVGTAIRVANSSRTVVYDASLVFMTDGIVMESGADLRIIASTCFLAQQDGLRINNVGASANFGGYGFIVEDSTRYDVNVLSATATVSGFGKASGDKFNITSGASVYTAFINLKEDDEGFDVQGEFHVGTPENPAESVFGGGDSYTRGMLVYTYNPAGAVWTDVSIAARSASGSTFTFPAVALDNAIYVASSLQDGGDYLQHYGIKVSTNTAAVLGVGEIVAEYWNGAAWVEIDHMSTLSSSPWTQYAKNIFERTGSEQVRYEQAFLSGWTKNDPMTLGTNYFWIRFRVATAVTTVPVFQQFKLHTNRSEINADGVLEFFGNARPERELVAHIQISSAVVGSAPANASVAFTATTTLSLTRNQFNDNQVHSYGQLITIPTGLDTSIPVTVEAVWYPDTNNSGDVEINVIPGQLAIGDLFDGSVVDGTTLSDINTVAANSQYESRLSSFDVDISDLTPGDFLVLRVERDATGGNLDDTLAGNIVNAEFRAFGKAWRA